MEQVRVSANDRVKGAKREARRLRRKGMIPAVIYGASKASATILVDEHEMELLLRGATHSNTVFDLSIGDGAGVSTMLREVQRHPVTDRLIHIDFLRVDITREIVMQVPLHVAGSMPPGVKTGGILEHLMRSVNIRCKPLEMPKRLEADLSALELNQSFFVRDLALPAGMAIMHDPNEPLFVILPPKKVEEEVPVAEAVVAEPEVITKKAEAEEPESAE